MAILAAYQPASRSLFIKPVFRLGVKALCAALLALYKLVALRGIIHEVGKVREQAQPTLLPVRLYLPLPSTLVAMPGGRQGVSRTAAAVAGVGAAVGTD